MKNSFIVLEGIEGAGKTTACNIIGQFLQDKNINDIVITHDPGGTPVAENLRYLIKHSIEKEKISDEAELLMLYSARIQLIEVIIKPALVRGAWVISDRYDLSTKAYQGAGRNINNKLITTIRNLILEKITPDLTFYLDVTPEIGLQRAKNRGKLDRIEQESIDFFVKVRQCYLEEVKKDIKIKFIDATQSLYAVKSKLHLEMEKWWRK
ncbi:MAG: dTMP kinase [Candidatus Dasytiphilus stammeri]